MAHRLLVPPVMRMEGQARLPLIQRPGEAITANFQQSMMTRDSLRRVKTSGTNIAHSPLPPLQRFVQAGPGAANDITNMAEGLRIRNAPRLVTKTRGQGAGI